MEGRRWGCYNDCVERQSRKGRDEVSVPRDRIIREEEWMLRDVMEVKICVIHEKGRRGGSVT